MFDIISEKNNLQDACRYYLIESGLALMVAFLINISVISVSGAVCNSATMTPDDREKCEDLDLNKASFLLQVCDIILSDNFYSLKFYVFHAFYNFVSLHDNVLFTFTTNRMF